MAAYIEDKNSNNISETNENKMFAKLEQTLVHILENNFKEDVDDTLIEKLLTVLYQETSFALLKQRTNELEMLLDRHDPHSLGTEEARYVWVSLIGILSSMGFVPSLAELLRTKVIQTDVDWSRKIRVSILKTLGEILHSHPDGSLWISQHENWLLQICNTVLFGERLNINAQQRFFSVLLLIGLFNVAFDPLFNSSIFLRRATVKFLSQCIASLDESVVLKLFDERESQMNMFYEAYCLFLSSGGNGCKFIGSRLFELQKHLAVSDETNVCFNMKFITLYCADNTLLQEEFYRCFRRDIHRVQFACGIYRSQKVPERRNFSFLCDVMKNNAIGAGNRISVLSVLQECGVSDASFRQVVETWLVGLMKTGVDNRDKENVAVSSDGRLTTKEISLGVSVAKGLAFNGDAWIDIVASIVDMPGDTCAFHTLYEALFICLRCLTTFERSMDVVRVFKRILEFGCEDGFEIVFSVIVDIIDVRCITDVDCSTGLMVICRECSLEEMAHQALVSSNCGDTRAAAFRFLTAFLLLSEKVSQDSVPSQADEPPPKTSCLSAIVDRFVRAICDEDDGRVRLVAVECCATIVKKVVLDKDMCRRLLESISWCMIKVNDSEIQIACLNVWDEHFAKSDLLDVHFLRDAGFLFALETLFSPACCLDVRRRSAQLILGERFASESTNSQLDVSFRKSPQYVQDVDTSSSSTFYVHKGCREGVDEVLDLSMRDALEDRLSSSTGLNKVCSSQQFEQCLSIADLRSIAANIILELTHSVVDTNASKDHLEEILDNLLLAVHNASKDCY